MREKEKEALLQECYDLMKQIIARGVKVTENTILLPETVSKRLDATLKKIVLVEESLIE